MAHADFFWFLSHSVSILEKESHENFLRLNVTLSGLRAKICDGTDTRIVYLQDRRLITTKNSPYNISINIDNNAILNIIDGKEFLRNAIDKNSIFIQGSVQTLAKYHSALGIFLDGALRSPGFPDLLSRYRSSLAAG